MIKATNETLNDIIKSEIEKLGQNADLNHIDVSNITNMKYMFYNSTFNGDISLWDVSKVTNMSCMFYDSNFNGDISKWNVSNITNMSCMFADSTYSGKVGKYYFENGKLLSDSELLLKKLQLLGE